MTKFLGRNLQTNAAQLPRKTRSPPQKFPRRTGSPPQEAAAYKRNMSCDSSSGCDSDRDKARDRTLEKAQRKDAFGRTRPKFQDLKNAEEEKEEEQIHAPYEKDAGIISPKGFPAFKEANIDEFHAAKSKQHIRAYIQEVVCKPIIGDPNGKAIGTGSFWKRKPFDYSDCK